MRRELAKLGVRGDETGAGGPRFSRWDSATSATRAPTVQVIPSDVHPAAGAGAVGQRAAGPGAQQPRAADRVAKAQNRRTSDGLHSWLYQFWALAVEHEKTMRRQMQMRHFLLDN